MAKPYHVEIGDRILANKMVGRKIESAYQTVIGVHQHSRMPNIWVFFFEDSGSMLIHENADLDIEQK